MKGHKDRHLHGLQDTRGRKRWRESLHPESMLPSILLIKESMNLVPDGVNIFRIEQIVIKRIADEVVDQIPLIFGEELAVDLLGECVCHGVGVSGTKVM